MKSGYARRALGAAVGFLGASAALAQPAGLVSHWRGEGNAGDSFGDNDGVASASVAYSAAVYGLGFALPGADEASIDVPGPVAGGLESAGGFTVACWLRQDSHVSTASIANLRTSGNSSGFTLENQFSGPGTITLYVHTTAVGWEPLYSTDWQLGGFDHIAATYDAASNSAVIYRNGDVVAERHDLSPATMTTSAEAIFRMGRNVVTGASLLGSIDEVYFFSRALTQVEVRSLICPGDFNFDHMVDLSDLGVVLASFGVDGGGDLDGDDDTDLSDLGVVLAGFGQPCP